MTTDGGLLRYLSTENFLPIRFTADESEGEGQFILALKDEVSSNGVEAIVANYPPLAAFFGNVHKHDSDISIALLEILGQGLDEFKQDLDEADSKLEKLSDAKKEMWRKTLPVIFFLLYKCYDTFGCLLLVEVDEEDDDRPSSARPKKPPKKKSKHNCYSFWYDWEIKLFNYLSQIISQPFNVALWKDADINFLSFLVSACSSLIRRTPNEVLNDNKYLESVVCVLGNLWTVHKMSTEILHVLNLAIVKSDHAIKLTTRIAKQLATKFNLKHICLNILEKSYRGMSSKSSDKEKSLAAFLVEMTELSPEYMYAGLPILRNMLFGDSFVLRCSVQVCAGLLLGFAKSEESMGLRGHLVRILLGHANDVNIVVRAKAIQVLTKLIDDKHLYLTEQIQALNVVARKVNDKAPSVRKAANSFFRALGSANPILTKFPLSAIQEKLKKHLQDLFTSMVTGVEDKEVELKFVSQQFIEEVNSNDYGFEKIKFPDEIQASENIVEYIDEQVRGRFYWKACEAIYVACEKYGEEITRYGGGKKVAAQYFVLFKKALSLPSGSLDDVEIELGAIGKSDKSIHDRERVNYYKGIKKLKSAFESSFPAFCRVLELGTPNDRKDTINLFATYCEDGFHPTPELTNSIMTALGKVDEKMASDLVDSFFRIFIPGVGKSPKETAGKLVNLVSTMTMENKEKMITLFQEVFKNTRSLNMKNCVEEFWTIYNHTDIQLAKAAVYLLGVKGSLDEKFILEWVDLMMNVGFGERGYQDFTLTIATCNSLLMMHEYCVTKEPDGLYEHHLLFEKVEEFIQHGLESFGENPSDQDYCDLVDVAIRLIYYICNDPLAIISEVVHCMSQYVFPTNFKDNPVLHEGRIHRYVALTDVIIECHVYYYEVIVVEEIKKRKALNELKKNEKRMGPPPAKNSKKSNAKNMGSNKDHTDRHGSRSTRYDTTNHERTLNGDVSLDRNSDSILSRRSMIHRMSKNVSVAQAIEKTNEMDEMVGVGVREFERIRDYLDSMLNEGMMSQIRLHIIHLCKQIDLLSRPTQVSCISLLTKVMCINNHGMFATMPFFLDLWERTKCPHLKIELIKSAIYINMRFPNSMEKCNASIMQGLRHEVMKIRIATLDFIIYLCLSEVIKVRQYLVESSICLNDAHKPLRDAAQDFFIKMSDKHNIVYNTIPEITKFLSNEENMSQPDFCNVMKFLLNKLKKPTQQTGLIEKFVARFKSLAVGRPRQDVAYCLSLLTYNDKTFRIIEESFNSYCDKLEDPLVFEAFVQIVNNAKKNCTKEYKITVEKYEKNLNTWKENCDNIEGANLGPTQSIESRRNNSRRTRRENRASSKDEDELVNDAEHGNSVVNTWKKNCDNTDGANHGTAQSTNESTRNSSRRRRRENRASSKDEDELVNDVEQENRVLSTSKENCDNIEGSNLGAAQSINESTRNSSRRRRRENRASSKDEDELVNDVEQENRVLSTSKENCDNIEGSNLGAAQSINESTMNNSHRRRHENRASSKDEDELVNDVEEGNSVVNTWKKNWDNIEGANHGTAQSSNESTMNNSRITPRVNRAASKGEGELVKIKEHGKSVGKQNRVSNSKGHASESSDSSFGIFSDSD